MATLGEIRLAYLTRHLSAWKPGDWERKRHPGLNFNRLGEIAAETWPQQGVAKGLDKIYERPK